MIVIIDYGVGNVRSVINALKHIGCDVKVSRDAADIESAAGLILPGVGASGYAMQKLGDTARPLKAAAQAGRPLLGICLGFQLLFERSFEHGTHTCLGLIGGDVIPIPAGRTIPHMGWNMVNFAGGMELFDGLGAGRHFAFAHSYYADVKDPSAKVAYTNYEGLDMAAAVRKDNIFGCQFHPEKSGPDGLDVLRNFDRLCRSKK